MTTPLDRLLALERIEDNLFRAQSMNLGPPQVFGGQVLGQALLAAQATVEDRDIHSMHAYFLRRGDVGAPIVYDVDRNRDGHSFSSRRVVAIQHGEPIFTMAASFHREEFSVDYEPPFALPPPPEETPLLSADATRRHQGPAPTDDFELRLVPREQCSEENTVQWWLKTRQPVTGGQAMHKAVLAFISDIGLGTAIMLPYGYDPRDLATLPPLMAASLDHALWFHRPVDLGDWLLYSCRPRINHRARGLGSGALYNRRGELVASTLQELLLRRQPGAIA